MLDPLSADRTAEMLLWYFQEPARYHAEGRRRDAPLLDSEVILKLALGRRGHFASPSLNEAANAAPLQQAAAAYVRLLFFRPDATPYQTLGLAPGASPEAIKESFRLLMHLVHPDRQAARALWPDGFAAQANRAYAVLRNQDLRTKLDDEAASRAAMARALNRAAAASSASIMPVVQRPKSRLGRHRFVPARLPEWLTAGLGGYVRDHPAATAFSVLIVSALLIVITMISERPEGRLVREAQDIEGAAAPKMMAAVRAVASAAATAARRSGAAESPGNDVPAKRLDVTGVGAPRVAAGPVVSEQASAVPSRTAEPAVAVASVPPPPPTAPLPAPVPLVSIARPEAGRVAPVPDAPPSAAPVTRAAPAESNVAVTRAPPAHSSLAVTRAPSADSNLTVTRTLPGDPNLSVTRTPPSEAIAQAPLAVVARDNPIVTTASPAATALTPATSEIEALFATFVESYERGRVDAFAALFDDDADTDLRHGRAAIRGEYEELFRQSHWRRMQLTRVNWRRIGDRAFAKGEITVRIGWRDGREVEQRLALDMEIVRRDGRVVIAQALAAAEVVSWRFGSLPCRA